jgi:hypothetical protein
MAQIVVEELRKSFFIAERDPGVLGALRGLVADRCYPATFPQDEEGNLTNKWPAIRYTIVSSIPAPDVCGSGDDDSADDTRVQIDCVAKTFGAADALRLQVIAALADIDPPCLRENSSGPLFDAETRTYRAVADYSFYPSSEVSS